MLNPKQQKFVLEYLKDLNATQAAIRAGYSAKTAYAQGSRLLSHAEVSAAVGKKQEKALTHLDVTAERIIRERARLAFFDPRKLFDDAGEPIHVSKLDDDTAACIAGLDIVTQGNSEVGFASVLKVKLADKNASLTALEKIQGLYSSGDEPAGVLNIHVHIG